MKLPKLARLVLTPFRGVASLRTTRRQKRAALAIAASVDFLQLALAPLFAAGALSPLDDALDLAAAGLLFLVLGRSWRIALALGVELIPGVALFPTWTAVVALMPATEASGDAPAIVPAA